jgi:two-component system, cell cycle response regulator
MMEPSPSPRILVVDDHPDNIELLRARLEARGYEVEGATGGEEAIQAVKAHPPDLILLDVMMPKVDGMEVVRRLKADKSLPFIPVIMQTALDSTENKVEGLDAGADDYITKPINFAELEARIKSLLRIKSLQEDLERREGELEDMNERLLHISRIDGLTEVANRRALEEKLEEMWAHSQRMHEPLSLVLCDIDKFKSVNDQYGHQVGDIVLKEFAGLLKEAVREIDRVGRYGGEEFLLLLPGTALDSAVTFAERLRQAVKEHKFSFDKGTLNRCMSCGVAGWPHPQIRNQDALVKAADDALYVAKETGRDKVVRFDSAEFNAHTGKEPVTNGDQSPHEAAKRSAGEQRSSNAIEAT